MRIWTGPRTENTLTEYNFSVTMVKYEDSVKLPCDWIINDKTGVVEQRMNELAFRYNPGWYNKLLADVVSNISIVAYDGVPFISDTRVLGQSGNIDNNLTASVSTSGAITAEEATSAIFRAYNQMLGFKDEAGAPANVDVTDLTVVCGAGSASAPALMQAVNSNVIKTAQGTQDNILKALGVNLSIIVDPRISLGGGLGFLLVNSSANAAPYVFAENKADFASAILGDESDYKVMNDAWLVTLKSNGAATVGRPTDVVYSLFV
jgi:hypothetical protein